MQTKRKRVEVWKSRCQGFIYIVWKMTRDDKESYLATENCTTTGKVKQFSERQEMNQAVETCKRWRALRLKALGAHAINVRVTVLYFLEKEGYDGLCRPDGCYCTKEDLFRCNGSILKLGDCITGVKHSTKGIVPAEEAEEVTC